MSVNSKKLLVSAACLLTAGGLVLPEAFAKRWAGTPPGGTSSEPRPSVTVRSPRDQQVLRLPIYHHIPVVGRYSLSAFVEAGKPIPPGPGQTEYRQMMAVIGEVRVHNGTPGSPVSVFTLIPLDYEARYFQLNGQVNYDLDFHLSPRQGEPFPGRNGDYYYHGYVRAKVLLNSGEYKVGQNSVFYEH